MNLREFIEEVGRLGNLKKIKEEVNPNLGVAKILKGNEDKVVLFESVKDSNYKIVGGVCNSRENLSLAIKTERTRLLHKILNAIENPTEPRIVGSGKCQEVIERRVDLTKLPILTHTSRDMGPYITSGVFIAKDPEFSYNMSIHRASPISKNKLVARICQRDLYEYFNRAEDELSISICIGLSPSILLAAAISVDIKMNELKIANSLSPLQLVKCKTNDLLVPADSEIVLEGRITKERHNEGPFPDVTRTYDSIREEPVIEIDCITHRKNPIYQALLPASREHGLLMGMPREPVIFKRVNEVCKCRDVLLTNGGCSWLHGIVKIEKRNPDDGKKAITAALKAHPSMKHVVIVDKDIDIHNPEEVEWAIATRFQAGYDMIMKHEKGSSLDPSAGKDSVSYKLGIDATIPDEKEWEKFQKIKLGE